MREILQYLKHNDERLDLETAMALVKRISERAFPPVGNLTV
jgi:hypothetical protein